MYDCSKFDQKTLPKFEQDEEEDSEDWYDYDRSDFKNFENLISKTNPQLKCTTEAVPCEKKNQGLLTVINDSPTRVQINLSGYKREMESRRKRMVKELNKNTRSQRSSSNKTKKCFFQSRKKENLRNSSIKLIKNLSSQRNLEKKDLVKRSKSKESRRMSNRMKSSLSRKKFRNISKNSNSRKNSITKKVNSLENKIEEALNSIDPPKDLEIIEITETSKQKVVNWLKNYCFIQNSTKIESLHMDSRSGEFLFDLVNKIARKPVLKGKSTNNYTSIKINYKKIFEFLKKNEKFNPRYLNSTYYLILGDYDIFWGLLSDFYYSAIGQISPDDQRYYSLVEQTQNLKKSKIVNFEGKIHKKGDAYDEAQIEYISNLEAKDYFEDSQEQITTQEKQIQNEIKKLEENLKRIQNQEKENLRNSQKKTKISPKKEQTYLGQFESKMKVLSNSKLNRTNQSILKSELGVRYINLEAKSGRQPKMDIENIISIEKTAKNWLIEKGFKIKENLSLLQDPIRNGYLLCALINKVHQTQLNGIYPRPKTFQECFNNVEIAFEVLKEFPQLYPFNLLWRKEDWVKGDPTVIWPIFLAMKDFEEKKTLDNSILSLTKDKFLTAPNIKVLPYTKDELEMLCDSLQFWLIKLGVFNQENLLPSSFEEILTRINDGILLVRISEKVLGRKIKGVHYKPNSVTNEKYNMDLCFEQLKKEKRMSLKFLWKANEILKCSFLYVVGLLEDIHRFYDGLPARSGNNYFQDGPYLPSFENSFTLQKEEKFISESKPNKNTILKINENFDKILKDPTTDSVETFGKKEINQNNNPQKSFEQKKSENNEIEESSVSEKNETNLIKWVPENLRTYLQNSSTQKYLEEGDQGSSPTFEEIIPVIKLLLLAKLPKIVERETWEQDIWAQFSNG